MNNNHVTKWFSGVIAPCLEIGMWLEMSPLPSWYGIGMHFIGAIPMCL